MQRKPSQITGIVDRKYMFLAEESKRITGIEERKYMFLVEETKPDYRY